MKILIKFLIIVSVAIGVSCDFKNSLVDDNTQQFNSIIVDNEGFNGAHVSTRPHNRKVIYDAQDGRWFVFYGLGHIDNEGKYRIFWKTSTDGLIWSKRKTAYEGHVNSSSVDVFLTNKKITMLIFRPFFHCEKAGIPSEIDGQKWYKRNIHDFPLPYEICQFDIKGDDLNPGPIYTAIEGNSHNGFPNYGSLTQDSNGYFWVGARMSEITEKRPSKALVARSSQPNDISRWDAPTWLLEASGKGTVAVQVVALDQGKVFASIFSQSDVKTFGTLYDPQKKVWQPPYVIAEGNSKSKRSVDCFDPGEKRLHFVYVDDDATLRHKTLLSPYNEDNWTPGSGENTAGVKIASNVDSKPWADNNISLSIDTSTIPAKLVVAYHQKTPNYRMRLYDGKKWSEKEISLGLRNKNRISDEISIIRNYKDKLGLIYYEYTTKKNPNGELHFIEIPKNKISDIF